MKKTREKLRKQHRISIFMLVMMLVATTFFATISDQAAYAASSAASKKVSAAQSALVIAGTLKPVEGIDTNISDVAQNIVDKAVSGVTVEAVSSANPQIQGSTIVYGTTDQSGEVTFSLTVKTLTSKQNVNVVVPATSNLVQDAAIPAVLYPLAYNANGGINAPTDSDSPYAEIETVRVLGIGAMTYAGHTFINWNTQADGNGVSYDPGDTFKMPKSYNVVLYAIWKTDESAATEPEATEPPASDAAPVLNLPAPITAEATGSAGAVVKFAVTAYDQEDGNLVVNCTPYSGSTFPIGTTIVKCEATDSFGNKVSGSFNITVQDKTAPVITVPADVAVEVSTIPTAVNIGKATATDAVGVTSITNNAPSAYPAGTTTVTWTASDAAGNKTTATQKVVVTAVTNEVITYLPEYLQADNLTNPSQALQNFLNTCSGKKVVFPAGKTYVLEKQLVIHDVSNLEIDFNGATFKLPNNCAIASRSDTGHYVPANTAIVIHDASNLTIKNYIIDGNKANIPTTTWCTGMAIMDVNGLESYNGYFKNCNYHHIVMGPTNVSAYNKNINFTKTTFKDHGGATGGAGISDVYINNRSTDNFSFIGVIVDNTTLKDYSLQAQCFYVAGFNGYFEDVVTNNCAVPLDIRYGSHVAKDFTVTNGERVLMLQPYPGGNGTNGYARITASNFVGRNLKGGANGGATGLYIIACDEANLDNFDLEMDASSSIAMYGIRIRKYYAEFPINNVNITNTTVKNFKVAGLIFEGMNTSTHFENLSLTGATSSTYGVKTASCTAYQYIKGLTTFNCIKFSSPDGMLKLL